MVDIVNIRGESIFDNHVVKFEFHTYSPYVNTTFEHNDKIRVPTITHTQIPITIARFIYVNV